MKDDKTFIIIFINFPVCTLLPYSIYLLAKPLRSTPFIVLDSKNFLSVLRECNYISILFMLTIRRVFVLLLVEIRYKRQFTRGIKCIRT